MATMWNDTLRKSPLSPRQIRAIYRTKAAMISLLVIFLLVFKVFLYPGMHSEQTMLIGLLILVPTLGVAFRKGEISTAIFGASLATDALAVTAGIHFGGGVDNSTGPILYVVLIALAGIIMRPRAAFLAALGCSLLYGTMAWLEWAQILPHMVAQSKTGAHTVATFAIVSVYLVLVAWLVSYSAQRIWALYAHVEELRGETFGARSVTIVTSDIEGFTAMTERLGDREAHRVVSRHHSIVRARIAQHEGFEVELKGDGFVLAFGSTQQAFDCALGIQRDLKRHNEENRDEPIRVRIGLHVGEALRSGESYFGKTVLTASAIGALGRGTELIISAPVKERTQTREGVTIAAGREVRLAGLSEPCTVHHVAWT